NVDVTGDQNLSGKRRELNLPARTAGATTITTDVAATTTSTTVRAEVAVYADIRLRGHHRLAAGTAGAGRGLPGHSATAADSTETGKIDARCANAAGDCHNLQVGVSRLNRRGQ